MESGLLAGKTVLVVASEERTVRLAEMLQARGALAIPFPTVRIVPPQDPGALDEAVRRWCAFDWVVFTSSNGVDAVVARAKALAIDLTAGSAKIAAVGPATKAAAESAGLAVRAMPEEYLTDEIASALGDVCGQSILLPRSALARRSLADELRARGASVRDVVAYDPTIAEPDLDRLRSAGRIDVIVFTSASAARNLAALLSEEDVRRLREEAEAACIGPITAEAVRELGFRIASVSGEHTVAGLIKAVEEVEAHG
ncbi:MAG: uroporphyrinogen-III synthase [Methanobacteriota archaeon]